MNIKKSMKEFLAGALGHETVTEIHGTGEILITGCTRILEYDDEKVSADTVSGKLTVIGNELCIYELRSDLLSVTGKINNIIFGGNDV